MLEQTKSSLLRCILSFQSTPLPFLRDKRQRDNVTLAETNGAAAPKKQTVQHRNRGQSDDKRWLYNNLFFSPFGSYCRRGSSLAMATRPPSCSASTNASCFTLVPRRGLMGRIIYASAWRMIHQTGRCQFLPSFPMTAVFILRGISFQISLSWVVYWKQASAFSHLFFAERLALVIFHKYIKEAATLFFSSNMCPCCLMDT